MSPLHDRIAAYAQGAIDFPDLMAAAAQDPGLDSQRLGAVYTPDWIVERILNALHPLPHHHVLEPAVGRGAFLVPLLERCTAGMDGPAALAWLNTHTLAFDIDPHAIADLRAILQAWFWRTHDLAVGPDAFTALHCADGLATPLPRRFDFAIGNPPYVRFQSLPPAQRAWLQAHYASCAQGNVDLYYAFIERALTGADHLGFIVPNSFITTQSGQALRRLLDGRVSHILDFGARKVFPGVGTYTCLLFAAPHAPRAQIVQADTQISRPFVASPARPPAVRTVLSGIATLCDKAYAVRRENGGFVACHTGMPVEAARVRPLIKATKFRGHVDAQWESFVLYPYEDGALLSPQELAAFPQALAHLHAVRPLLEARDRGKTDRYAQWYAYGRGQGLTPLRGPHALIIPAMMGGHSQPALADLRPLQAWGGPLVVSGYAIDAPTPQDTAAILSPAFAQTVALHGAAKPGAGGTLYHAVASWMAKSQPAPPPESPASPA